LKLTYREGGTAERKMTTTGDAWVERSSGDNVVSEMREENIPFGPQGPGAPAVSGVFRTDRMSGSPVGLMGPDPQGAAPTGPARRERGIEDVVKDYEKLTGLFTLYRKKENGRETLYLEVKEEQLNRLLLLQVTSSTGAASQALAPGSPIGDIPFKFVQRDDQVLLVVPNLSYVADPKKAMARAAKRSFADAYLEAYRVEAKSADRKSLLINVTDLFRSDIALITVDVARATGGGYGIDREKTVFGPIKAFPENLVVQTDYHFSRGGGGGIAIGGGGGGGVSEAQADPRSLPLSVIYNLSFLPADGYRQRLADARVGYFTTEAQDFSDDRDEQTRRCILRWRLEKKDPNATLSEPKEPIVFWLDNAIPEEYRDAVGRGILMWNGALERIGIKNGIVVKQMPDNADWDHADLRHNVIRWVASAGNGYAVAQFRANPITGQILNAAITVDSNMTRFTRREFNRNVDPLAAFSEPPPSASNRLMCSYAQEALPQAWFGLSALNLMAGPQGKKVNEKEYISQFLTSVVAHEMGHIMGLRHNFIASTFHSMKELASGERLRKVGAVSSVMDYIPFNIAALHSADPVYWTPTLGAYDHWAIEYGYKELPANTTDAEKPQLQTIAARCNWPGHAYLSDENADSWDPLVTRFDLAKDPLEYWSAYFVDLRKLVQQLPSRVPKRGESYYEFTRHFNSYLAQYARAAATVTRFVGGLNLRRNHRGDMGEKPPLVPVSAADQARALGLLRQYVFARDAFNVPKSALLNLGPDPFPDFGAILGGGLRTDAPVRDNIASMQRQTLSRLFTGGTLGRVANNEFKVGTSAGTLTLATLFGTVTDAVFEEARGALPVDTLRRQLQRSYVDTLEEMILRTPAGTPDDAKMLARHHLRTLRGQLAAAARRSQDQYTKIHFTDLADDISKALDARVNLGGGSGGGGGQVIRILGTDGAK
jgi:hypothetical protein